MCTVMFQYVIFTSTRDLAMEYPYKLRYMKRDRSRIVRVCSAAEQKEHDMLMALTSRYLETTQAKCVHYRSIYTTR